MSPSEKPLELAPLWGLTGDQGTHTPKTGLLMMTLDLIFMQASCVPEEVFWEVWRVLQVYSSQKHSPWGAVAKAHRQSLCVTRVSGAQVGVRRQSRVLSVCLWGSHRKQDRWKSRSLWPK
jgi:hypothetical protein